MPEGPFKVVLQSIDATWNPRVRSEVSRLFQIDDETASNIVSAIPIIVIDGLDARVAGIVRDRLRPVGDAGCRVVITDDPSETIPRVNWPELPEVAHVADDDAVTARVIRVAHDAPPPLVVFQCPGCGSSFQISRTPASALATETPATIAPPPAVAPRPSSPPASAPPPRASLPPPVAAAPPPAPPPVVAAPAPAARTPGSDVGAKLEGDWLDPPLGASAPPPSIPPPVAIAASPTARPAPAAAPPKPSAPPSPAPSARPPDALAPAEDVFALSPKPSSAPGSSVLPPSGGGVTRSAPPLPSRLVGGPPGTARFTREPPPERAAPPPPPPPPPAREEILTASDPEPSEELDLAFADDEISIESDERALTGKLPKDDEARPPKGVDDSGELKLPEVEELGLAKDRAPAAASRARAPVLDESSDLDAIANAEPAARERFEEPARSARPARPARPASVDAPERVPALAGAGVPRSSPATSRGGSSASPPREKARGRPRDLSFDEALALFSEEELGPPDPAPSGLGSEDETPEIKPFDISDQGPVHAPAPREKKLERPIEPLESDDGELLGVTPPRGARDKGVHQLEPLDPGEALSILGDDGRKGKKDKASRKARRAEGSGTKLVPLSASDEDFRFLDPGRKGKGPADEDAPDGSDEGPAAARKGGGGAGQDIDESPVDGKPAKRADPFARAARALAEEESRSRSPAPAKGEPASERRPAAKGGGGGGRAVVEGTGEHGLVLSRIASEPLRQKAAELISEIKGWSFDDALKLTDRTIIPVLKGVSLEVAEAHLERFKKAKISGRVTTRQKDR